MNYKLLKHILFSFVLILVYSCKKESLPQTTVHGVASNRLTGELVENIPINIIECDGLPQKCLKIIQTVYTDVAGRYNTSFLWDNGKAYKLAIGVNNTLANSPYPYYDLITRNIDNTINYSQFPLKVLQIRFNVLRHDKNWLNLSIRANDTFGFFAKDFYFGANPVNDFDETYTIKIEAGRDYIAYVGLSNKVADYTYQDNDFASKVFTVNNIDTTKIEFIVQ